MLNNFTFLHNYKCSQPLSPSGTIVHFEALENEGWNFSCGIQVKSKTSVLTRQHKASKMDGHEEITTLATSKQCSMKEH